MPCEYHTPTENLNIAHQHLDEMAQNLCYLCGELKSRGLLEECASERVLEWWKAHEKNDTKRVIGKLRDMFSNDLGLEPIPAAYTLIKRAKVEHPVSNYHKEWFKRLAAKVYKEVHSLQKKRNDALQKLTKKERKTLGL